MGQIGTIAGNFASAKTYKAQARVAEAQGRAQRSAAYRRAFNLEEEARADSVLVGKNMMTARENETAALATVRNERGASGLTQEGSGGVAEALTADVFDKAIGDLALSNAISDSNKRYSADVSRFQGDLAMQQASAQAAQYGRLGKSARNAGWIQSGLLAASAGVGGVMGAGTGSVFDFREAGKMMNSTGYLSDMMLSWSPGAINSPPKNKYGQDSYGGASAAFDEIFKFIFSNKK
ncbi:MAG: hypothetical protein RR719_07080 [Akkermansia sp.]